MDPSKILEDGFLQRFKNLYETTCMKYSESQIQQFYNGTTVFITGGTGFMGKHLIEKILRATNVSIIFVLMRSKKGKPIKERLNEMLQDPVYELLREKIPQFHQKLVPISGDVAELRLGMSDDDWNIVTQQVRNPKKNVLMIGLIVGKSIVPKVAYFEAKKNLWSLKYKLLELRNTDIIFHVAATTRFDESLRIATLTNVRGTRETLILGTQCKKLRSFVHVSTAYSYARTDMVNKDILEDFYPSPVDPEALIQLVESLEESRLNDIKPGLIKGWPNTYAFTKAVSEELIRTQGKYIPLCIIRPAVVVGAYREPFPGWVDLSCVYGATGLVLAGSLGVAHGIYIGRNVKLGFIPVDYVNNAIISAGWETAHRLDEKLKIYIVTMSTRNGIKYGKIQELFDEAAHEYPLPDSVWYYFILLTANPVLFYIYSWILHIIPAYIADGICLLMGKKRIAVKMAKKLYIMSKALSYFCTNNWNFEDKNLVALHEKLTPIDKELFDFDLMKLNWKDYLTIFGMGIRKYIVKDGLSRTEYARKKQKIFCVLMIIIFPLYLYMLYKIVYLSVFSLTYIFNLVR